MASLMKNLILTLACLIFIFTNACATDRPRAKTAQSVTRSYLKHYGRKHKAAPFYRNVDRVNINAIEPVSHRVAHTDAIVHLKDGQVARVLLKMENKFPQGWKVQSWEVLGIR